MFNVLLAFLFTLTTSYEGSSAAEPAGYNDSQVKQSVLYVFAGSDWCANCRRLETKVLSDSTFLSALDSGLVRIEILDFPQRKKQSPETISYNRSMSEKLGFNGDFPTIVIYSGIRDKYSTLTYKNEDPSEFSRIVLNELSKLNE
jgi:hypothetical protein